MSDDDRRCHRILKTSLVCAPSWTSGIGAADDSDTDDSKFDEPSSTTSQDSFDTNSTANCSTSNLENNNHQQQTTTATTLNDLEQLDISIPTVYLTRKDPSSSSYHIYQIDIRSNCGSNWSIYRRYSQFHTLHQRLRAQDSAIDKISFPPKRRINSKTSTLVQDRRVKLESYMRSLCCYIEKSRPDCDRDSDSDLFYQFIAYSTKITESLEHLQSSAPQPSEGQTTDS